MAFPTLTRMDSSIFTKLKRLRRLLYTCQFLFSKADRIIYGTSLMNESAETIEWFMKAYHRREPSAKLAALEECVATFAVLRQDIDFCIERNIIHFPKRKAKPGRPALSEDEAVNSQKLELWELLGTIDEEMSKWMAKMYKGKTVIDIKQVDGGSSDKLEE